MLKACIKAFRRAVNEEASIDPVLAVVLKHSKNRNKEVRKTCLETLVFIWNNLPIRSKLMHTYLRPTRMAQNLYKFLGDSCAEIR